ncbi:MAG: hypothetical protein KAH23_10400 [Kiritimatiellae bacterium]|nr:hypothetical protein [Kiritimatiellia bacterium]
MVITGMCGYFDKYRSKKVIKQNRQEIEQAIDSVKGRDVDTEIKKIWERVLK